MNPASRSEEKEQRILEAVSRILARKGYAGTTIALVAAEAGVSRGLLHYYFESKEEMLAKVLKANMESNVPLLQSIFEQSDSPEAFSEQLISTLRDLMEHNPEYFNLFFEGLAVARQSTLVTEELTSIYGGFRGAFQKGLETLVEKGLINPVLPLSGLAALITGILDGMALQFVTVPQVIDDDEVWETMQAGVLLLLREHV
jgi:AcrR family transcriptional regulator